MHISHTCVYPGKLRDVLAALVSDELAQARAERTGVGPARHTVSSDGASATTLITVTENKLPSSAQRFIKTPQDFSVTQNWVVTDDDHAQATFDIDLGGLPGSVRVTQTLSEESGQTRSVYKGDISVSVPLIGRRIEKMVANSVSEYIEEDLQLVVEVLA